MALDVQEIRESPQALQAYVLYRDMGPDRSLEAVAQELHKSKTIIARWSGRHGWVERVAEHDRAIAKAAEERDKKERLKEIEKRRKQRLDVATGMRLKAVEAIKTMDSKELARRPSAVVAMIRQANDDERMDMGEPTSRTAVTDADGGPVRVILHLGRMDGTGDAPTDL